MFFSFLFPEEVAENVGVEVDEGADDFQAVEPVQAGEGRIRFHIFPESGSVAVWALQNAFENLIVNE